MIVTLLLGIGVAVALSVTCIKALAENIKMSNRINELEEYEQIVKAWMK